MERPFQTRRGLTPDSGATTRRRCPTRGRSLPAIFAGADRTAVVAPVVDTFETVKQLSRRSVRLSRRALTLSTLISRNRLFWRRGLGAARGPTRRAAVRRRVPGQPRYRGGAVSRRTAGDRGPRGRTHPRRHRTGRPRDRSRHRTLERVASKRSATAPNGDGDGFDADGWTRR